jgi:hypothetical protein
MEFELKKASTVGGVVSNNDGTMTQHLNITVGVVGCPYEDIKTEKTVPYIFSENLTAKQVEDAIPTFAAAWVATTYPTV